MALVHRASAGQRHGESGQKKRSCTRSCPKIWFFASARPMAGIGRSGGGGGAHIKGLEAPPQRNHARVWDARELESAVERERSGRLAAEARAAELQARLRDAQDEIVRLREQLAAGGGPGRPNDGMSWRPRPSTGSARGTDPHASPQQRPYSVSAAAAPEHLYVTQASSPPAQPPPPMSSGAVSAYVSFPGASLWLRSVSTNCCPAVVHAATCARLRLRLRLRLRPPLSTAASPAVCRHAGRVYPQSCAHSEARAPFPWPLQPAAAAPPLVPQPPTTRARIPRGSATQRGNGRVDGAGVPGGSHFAVSLGASSALPGPHGPLCRRDSAGCRPRQSQFRGRTARWGWRRDRGAGASRSLSLAPPHAARRFCWGRGWWG